MPRKSPKPLKNLLVNLYEGDAETLKQFFPKLGHTVAVRELVHNTCNRLRERASREGVLTNVGTNPALDAIIESVAGASPSNSDG